MLVVATLLAAQVAATGSPPSDDALAASVTGVAFAQACVLRMAVDQTPAAFTAGSSEAGRQFLKLVAPPKGHLTIDDAAGRGCRVVYRGAEADLAWRSSRDVFTLGFANSGNGPCKPTTVTSDRLAADCRSEASSPGEPKTVARGADLLIFRTGDGTRATVTATLTNLRP